MWLRSCPRCEGDLYLREMYGVAYDGNAQAEVACRQCGHAMVASIGSRAGNESRASIANPRVLRLSA